tara:strand:- start:605 stop:841 length:237 start_codon:yes stop_codon:yes gene_type:complete
MLKQINNNQRRFLMSESTVYGIKIAVGILEQCDHVAEELSADAELFPTGKCTRADVVRLCLVRGLKGLAEEMGVNLKG